MKKLNARSFQFIIQITLTKHQKLKFLTSILKFGKRILDYKLKTTRIQFQGYG